MKVETLKRMSNYEKSDKKNTLTRNNGILYSFPS